MDTLRKAIHLHSVVKEDNYLDGSPVLLRGDGDVDDFLDTYNKPSGPERIQSVYCFLALCLCIGLSVLAGLRHGVSLAVQVLSTSLLAAVPALDAPRDAPLADIPGTVPPPDAWPDGCAFWPRCAAVRDRCTCEQPPDTADGPRRCACWCG